MHRGVHVHSGDSYLVLELSGDLDLGSIDPIRDELRELASTVSGTLVCDLADVTFLDSSAISLLVGLNRIVTSNGGLFVVVNVAPSVGRPLTLTRVDTTMPIYFVEPGERRAPTNSSPGM